MSSFSLNTIGLKTRLQIENQCKTLKYDKKNNYVSRDGVLWNDEITKKIKYNKKEACSDLVNILNKFNAKSLIVGHTKQLSHKIKSFCNNKYFLVDVGMSLFMNNGQPYPSYLLIIDGKFKSIRLIINKNKNNCQPIHIKSYQKHNKKYCIQEKVTQF
ncbi:shewanella-like protein phosphatase 1, putative [Hepatocystis sp. ex Piliocolobus tephrosceles]|nr:shewanella-like protein phosphatase 1, putative [Hepatocystis sp. ex Piliocolobus tephrosceles]